MLQSMTGFGKAEVQLPDKKVIIEIKSLNSKNIDTNIKTPLIYREKEVEIRKILYERLIRGKIDCSIYYELKEDATTAIINKEVFRKYYQEIKELQFELSLKKEDVIEAILRLPDTIKTEQPEFDEKEWEEVLKGIDKALLQLTKFREQDGAAMATDLSERVNSISNLLKKIEPYEKERIERLKERIRKNLQDFLQSEEYDENRFEQELFFYIEKLDISEEKVRLKNHCDYFSEILQLNEPVGKKLGFIAQEIGREINTLGSKANHHEIQKTVVQMKDELERIKEQLANIL